MTVPELRRRSLEGTLVRWIELDDTAPAPGRLALLDAGERRRYEAKRSAAERARFLGAALLMREVVAELVGADPTQVGLTRECPDCAEPHGRPVPTGAGAGRHVSASHTGSFVVVAAGDPPVGVDVEGVRAAPPSPGLVDRVVTREEERPTDPAGFARLWAAKEAYLKAIGTGLAVPMSRVVLGDGVAILADGEAPEGRLTRLDAPPGHVAWLCELSPPGRRSRTGGAR